MIFTFTLYFLVYGRDLVRIGLVGLMPAGIPGALLGRRARHLQDEQGVLVREVPHRGHRRAHDLRDDEAARACRTPPPLPLFVGITDLIPNIGATLGTIPVVIVGLLEEPWKGVVAGVVLILYQQVENNLITPRIFKETVEIHPFLSVVDRDRLHVALRHRRCADRRAGDQGDRDSVRRSARGDARLRSSLRCPSLATKPSLKTPDPRTRGPTDLTGRTLLGRPRGCQGTRVTRVNGGAGRG